MGQTDKIPIILNLNYLHQHVRSGKGTQWDKGNKEDVPAVTHSLAPFIPCGSFLKTLDGPSSLDET